MCCISSCIGPSHISLLSGLIALCGHAEEQTMQFGCGFFFLLILTKLLFVCFCDLNCRHNSFIQFSISKNQCRGLYRETGSKCVYARERGRGKREKRACESHYGSHFLRTLFHFLITDATERQIKKLYSNQYDQAEHLSQISNIKI